MSEPRLQDCEEAVRTQQVFTTALGQGSALGLFPGVTLSGLSEGPPKSCPPGTHEHHCVEMGSLKKTSNILR